MTLVKFLYFRVIFFVGNKMMDNSYNNPKFAQLYDLIVKINELEKIELPYWEACAKYWGGPILEMGCGTGRLLLPLAKKGYEITGLDTSNSMLNELRQKVNKYPPEVQHKIKLKHGNMLDEDAPGKFHLIIFAVSLFLHLKNDEERLKCLNNCRQLLADEGVLILSNSKFEESMVESPETKKVIVQDKSGDRKKFYCTENEWRNGAYIDSFNFISESSGEKEVYFWSLYPIEDAHMIELIENAKLKIITPPSSIIPFMREGALFYICGREEIK